MAVLLVCPDVVGPEMAGPGIRYHELGRALAASHDVTLAAPIGSSSLPGGPPLVTYDRSRRSTLLGLIRRADVVVSPPLPPHLVAPASREGRLWIVDFYDPEPFEGLEYQLARPRFERKARDVLRIDRIVFAARAGGAFICASERQRDMWLGFLAACRRLDSDAYAHDRELRSLVEIVPFGLPDEPPEPATEPFLRGAVFPPDARVIVWNGGLWDWFDPLTVLRAVSLLRRDDPAWRIAFLGTGRPGREVGMSMAAAARELADELDLVGSGAAYFHAGWTPYASRGAALLECNIGVTAHLPTLEARFAHRSRMLDLLWAGLPIVCSTGDEWADRVAKDRLGEVAPPGDPEALAGALRRVVSNGRGVYAEQIRKTASDHRWSRVAEPLAGLIAAPPARKRVGTGAWMAAARHTGAELIMRAGARARSGGGGPPRAAG